MAAKQGAPHGTHNRTIRPDLAWMNSAACHGEDLELFFGPEGERHAERVLRQERAMDLCYGCPVRRRCLEYALTLGVKHGTWGGLNPEERAAEQRRRRRRAASGRAVEDITGYDDEAFASEEAS